MTLPRRMYKGSVGIENKGGKLRLRLSRAYHPEGKQVYISTRLPDTPDNRKKAQVKAWEIEEDLARGDFDLSLARYTFQPKISLVSRNGSPVEAIKLIDLWDSFCQYKRPQLEESTFIKEYQGDYRKRIETLPSQSLGDAVAIRDHLLQTRTLDVAKRTLIRLSACCDWAVDSGKIAANPFTRMATKIRAPKADPNEDFLDDIDPFSPSERAAILEGFYRIKPYYGPFVEFLFLTGCRPGEALALTWEDYRDSHLRIVKSWSYLLGKTKPTKTGVARKFPVNSQLADLLERVRANSDTDLIFPGMKGGHMAYENFVHQVWKGGRHSDRKRYRGVMPELLEAGTVERYRPPYNTRHTFITEMVNGGVPIPQVAKIVGNSPKVLLDHYCGADFSRISLPQI